MSDSDMTFPEDWVTGGGSAAPVELDEEFKKMARDAAQLAMIDHATDGGGADNDAEVIEFRGCILVKWSQGLLPWIVLDHETVLNVDTELADSIYRSDDDEATNQ